MNAVPCRTPLESSVLADYWLADLPPATEAAVEDHLLVCAECSGRLQREAELAGGIRAVVRQRILRVVVTEAFVDRLIGEGLRVREYRVAPGGRVACTVTAEDDLVVGRLAVPPAGEARVDLALCDAEGRELQRLSDIPVNPSATEVVFAQDMEALRSRPTSVHRIRLLAIDADGERLLGEYTFEHTQSIRA